MRAAPSLSQIEFRGHLARSHNRLLQLDFGAYAKGAAIDATFDALQRQGVRTPAAGHMAEAGSEA